jgi:TolB protein
MKSLRILVIATALTTSSVVAGQQANESADQQLKAAMHRELVGGDLRAAIKDYEGIVSRYRDNRPVAARALLQIAQCHDKLGQPEARKVYEQIVREYADQTEPAAQARTRLAAMSPQSATATPPDVGVARRLHGPPVTSSLMGISRDGSLVAASDYSKGINLGVYDLTAPQMRVITDFDWTTTGVHDVWAAWSPDGRRIAYTQIGMRGVLASELRTTTLTGEARTVFRAEPGALVLPADWMPDGRSLLVLLGRSDKTSVIGMIPANGGAFTQLRSLQWAGGYPDQPRVSPDGRFVLFSDASSGPRDIYSVSVDGRTSTRLTDHPADDRSPVWSPDGRHVAFLSSRLGNDAIWVLAVKDGMPAGEPVRIKDGLQSASLKEWTRKGLVFGELTRTSDVYTVALNPATPRTTGRPQQIAFGRTGRNSGPVWSPDGRFLAFVSGSPAEPNRRFIIVLPAKGGDPREFMIPTSRFAPGGLDPFDLRWFGDGSGLGFSGFDDQGQRALFHLTLASGQWKTSPNPAGRQIHVEWDQTGRRVLYARDGAQIVERDLETSQDRVVTTNAGMSIVRYLRLSPDRRWLAFTLRPAAGVPETPRVMVTDVRSGDTRTILDEKVLATADEYAVYGTPAWSPDGRSMVVPRTTSRDRSPEFVVIPLDGSPSRSIALDKAFISSTRSAEDFGPPITDVVWTPDGTQFMFALLSSRGSKWLIESVVPPAGSTTRVTR